MEEENDYINRFKKSRLPEVPEGFFDNFYASLKDDLEAADVFSQFNIRKSSTVNEIKLRPIVLPKKKNTKIIRLGIVSIITSAAAALAVLFYINLNTTEQPITESPVKETNYDSYLAYVDESTLVDYILDNEVDMNSDFDEDIYDVVQDDLEDIYYDL